MINVVWQDQAGNPPDAADLTSWVDSYGLTYTVLGDPDMSWWETFIEPTGEQFGTLLIDRDGTIVWKVIGENPTAADDARVEVEAMLEAETAR